MSLNAPRRFLLLLLMLCAALNYMMFLAIISPVLALVILPPHIGALAAIAVAAILTSVERIGNVARAVPPWVPTPSRDLEDLLALLPTDPAGAFVELGSGDGRNLIMAVEQLGFASAVGFELNPLLVWASRLQTWWAGHTERVQTFRADILTAQLPTADTAGLPIAAVYLYLSVGTLAKLAPRLQCVYGGGSTAIFSRDFHLPEEWGEPAHSIDRGPTQLLAYHAPPPERGDWDCATATATASDATRHRRVGWLSWV